MPPPKPRRRWLQFRLRTLLVAVTLVSLLLGYVAWEREQCRRGQQAIEMLEQRSLWARAVRRVDSPKTPAQGRSKWLKSALGDNEFRRVNFAILEGDLFSDSDIGTLALFPNLETVVIQSPNVTDEGVAFLRGLKKVERFEFRDNRRVSGKCWEVLSEWHHLHELAFYNCHFGHDGILQIPTLPSLKELRICKTNLTDANLEWISLLANLETLDLSGSDVSDAGLLHLKRMANLKYLRLENTRISDPGVMQLQEALPNAVISHWKS